MSLRFKKIISSKPVIDYLASIISTQLSNGKRVLWLIPGGSGMTIAATVSKTLSTNGADLGNLTVSLTDERYGPVGHEDSNFKQLLDAGFEVKNAQVVPVLTGKDLAQTVQDFAQNLKRMFDANDYSIGFFGIGPDGHTAGMLPGSPAIKSGELASAYEDSAFVGKNSDKEKHGISRITMTPPAITKLNEIVVYATGEAKWPILDQLDTELLVSQQPAQILKQVPKLTIFNDYKGELA